jgi:hypothetical protein
MPNLSSSDVKALLARHEKANANVARITTLRSELPHVIFATLHGGPTSLQSVAHRWSDLPAEVQTEILNILARLFDGELTRVEEEMRQAGISP